MKKIWKVIILVLVAGIITGNLILDYRSQTQAHPQDIEAAELLGLSVVLLLVSWHLILPV